MSITPKDLSLSKAVMEILNQEAEKFIVKSVAEYEANIRKKIAECVMQAHNFYNLTRHGEELIITVKLGNGK